MAQDAPPGTAFVPRATTIFIAVSLAIVAVLNLYALWAFWPETGEQAATTEAQRVSFFGWHPDPSREFLFFLTVALAGGLGGLVHAVRSLSWYIGNRRLRWSWIPFILLLPIVGALGGTVFYLVLRAGLFSPATSVDEANPFGFAAVAGLVGLFSEQALEKLRLVASDLFAESPSGEDHVEPQDSERSRPRGRS